mmetsp:Transcript_60029/g.72142  ORF Transcript_60029/g.72142 Transcript_60029/m.72142 type:complete len:412 (+) Transcript_60029:201-1436(+)
MIRVTASFLITFITVSTVEGFYPQQISNNRVVLNNQISNVRKSRLSYDANDVVAEVGDVEQTEEELKILQRASQICDERNIKFECIKNARDLSSVNNSPIHANRVIRMGKVSDSTSTDKDMLFNTLGIKTFIDLRSPTELKEDEKINDCTTFGDFITLVWRPSKVSNRDRVKEKGVNAHWKSGEEFGSVTSENDMGLVNCCDGVVISQDAKTRKERHFVSLMDEFKYVRGTLSVMRKRDIFRALLKSPGAIFSKRVRQSVKDVFLDEINDGGLPMLNELMMRMGAPGIKYVLDIISDEDRHPVAFYCTAGKDRTGIISALILSLVGVPAEDIVEDYSLSANVYAQINDHKAMVGALSQRNLNPKTFLGAPPKVMEETLISIKDNYGSVEGYLDWIGFGQEQREKLKAALLS